MESLLNRVEGGWKKNLVRSTLLPHEAKAILSILISHTFPEDALTWAWTPNGKFTVSSAYNVACSWLRERRNMADGCEVSDPKKRSKFWNFIWQLNCLSKIKQFMWRACKNILPTNYCLKLKKIPMEDTYGACGKVQSLGHAFWDCEVAKAV